MTMTQKVTELCTHYSMPVNCLLAKLLFFQRALGGGIKVPLRMRSSDAAQPAGAVPGGEGGGEPEFHPGRLPRLLAPLLRLDATGPPPGKDDF